MINQIVIPAITLALAVGCASAFAKGPGGQGRFDGPAHHDGTGRMGSRLGLSAEQQKKISEIRTKHSADLDAKTKAARDAHQAYTDAAAKPDAKADQLKSLHKTAADKQFEVMLARRAERLEVRGILTPEQREKAAWGKGFSEGRMGSMRQDHGMRQGRDTGMPMLRRLNLTDDQRKAMQEARTKAVNDEKDVAKAAQDARRAFADAAAKPETKQEELRKLHNALTDKNFELMQLHRSNRQAMLKILTPEQREKVEAMRGRMEDRRPGDRRSPRRGHDGGHRGGFGW